MSSLLYFDNASTTKIDSRVLDAMLPFLKEDFANPSSAHTFGQRIQKYIIEAKEKVSNLIGADTKEILFTSGATESINQSLKCLTIPGKKHIITVATEHKATINCCMYLESIGYEVTYLSVDGEGLIDLQELKDRIRPDTLLISVMMVNNETGVLQPIESISEIAHSTNCFFMTDATQAFGKIPIDVNNLGIDILAASAHKCYGPKGIGLLYLNRNIKNKIHPLIHGGEQQLGLRSGTLNAPSIIGFGKAAEISASEMEDVQKHIKKIRNDFEAEILQHQICKINGSYTKRIETISNVRFEDMDVDIILQGKNNLCISSGSACSSSTIEESHVLKAMGLSDNQSRSSIRVSFSKYNTSEEVNKLLTIIRTELDLKPTITT